MQVLSIQDFLGKALVAPKLPVQEDSQHRVQARPMHDELRKPAVILSLISQSLHQLQQVISELLIVSPLQSLHSKASDLQKWGCEWVCVL